MGNKYVNKEMAEATSGDFTITGTGTVYSESVDVSLIDSTKTEIINTSTITNASGGTITATVQSYVHGLGWVNTAITWTAGVYSTASETIVTSCTQGAFGTRIRMKLVATGTFGGTESHAQAFYIVGKQ